MIIIIVSFGGIIKVLYFFYYKVIMEYIDFVNLCLIFGIFWYYFVLMIEIIGVIIFEE